MHRADYYRYYYQRLHLTQILRLGPVTTRARSKQEADGRMMAVVNRPQVAAHRRYDITEAIRTVEALTLASAESALRERLALRPAAERHGRILRLRQGATLLRSKGEGWFKTQPLIGAGDRLGNNAWVREIRRSGSKLFVEPVNADAHQAVALAPMSILERFHAWHHAE